MRNLVQIGTIILTILFNTEIYPQPIIADFQVNENDTNRWDQFDPQVIALDNHTYLVFWQDSRIPNEERVYAQIFASNGNPQGESFCLEGVKSAYGAKTDTNGSFIIFGTSVDALGFFLHRFDSEGMPAGETSELGGTGGAVAWSDSGKFMTTWKGGNFYGDVYARLYAADGTPLTDDFKINEDLDPNIFQRNPSIAANSSGEYIITWEDGRDDFNGGDIWAQRYNKDGHKVGSNFPVNIDSPPDLIRQTGPACAINDSGKIVIAWNTRSWEHTDHGIYAQYFNRDGNRLGDNFVVTDTAYTPYSSQPEAPAIAVNQDGKFIITWSDYRNDNEDIYMQYYDSDGTAIGENFRINDDMSGL